MTRMDGTLKDINSHGGSPELRRVRQNGPAIRAFRIKDGYSQDGLGEAIGVDQAAISQIETEKVSARLATLNGIARALTIPVAAIMRELPELAQPEPVSEAVA